MAAVCAPPKGLRNKAGGHQVAGVVEGGVCRGCAGVVASTGLGAPRAWSCRRGMGCAVPFPPMAFDHSLVQWKHRRLASVCECGFADGTPGGEGDSIVVRSVTMHLSKQRAHAAPLRAPRSLRDGILRMYDI